MALEGRVRVNHPPDFIILGKPKWTELKMKEDIQGEGATEMTHVVDRLNPSRNMIGSIKTHYEEKAEMTQKVMENMMTDLRCELVVTLGDARLSQEQEARLMKEHLEWEELKNKYEWKPKPEPKLKASKEKIKKEKVKKPRVKKSKPKEKQMSSPEGGKENSVRSWSDIFPLNNRKFSEESKPKKKVQSKKVNPSMKTLSMMNWLVSDRNSDIS